MSLLFGIRPTRGVSSITPSNYSLDYEPVSFKSRDGLSLSGWWIDASHPAGVVVLVHGYDASKESVLSQAAFLHNANYSTLLFDTRGAGESEGDYVSMGYYERLDVLGAVDYLSKRVDISNTSLFGVGYSMGAAALVMAEAEEHNFNALVLDSLYSSLYENAARRFENVYGLPSFPFAALLTFFGGLILDVDGFTVAPSMSIAQVYVPVFIIKGTNDKTISFEDTQQIFLHAHEPKELWFVDGAEHTETYRKNPEIYESLVVSFFVNDNNH